MLTQPEFTTIINRFDRETPYTAVMVEVPEELRLVGHLRGEGDTADGVRGFFVGR